MDSPGGSGWTGHKTAMLANYILRGAAVVFTLIGAIVVGAAAETKAFFVGDILVNRTLKAVGITQLDYLIAVNAIVCFYSVVSIVLLASLRPTRNLFFILTISDIAAMILLFTGFSSAASTLIETGKGVTEICKIYTIFCAQVAASVSMTAFGAAAFLLLIILYILRLHLSSM